ncbi:hypothetical protein BGX38DRAFT_1262934 [Terfezia claveryi]|nr:hypothetical protein BGX38DRAFT_1262934 [Terfezia claveryi]
MGDFTMDSDDEDLAVGGFGGAADSADEEEAASDSSNDDEDKNSDDNENGSDSEASVVMHPLDNALTKPKQLTKMPSSLQNQSNCKLADETPSLQLMNLSGLSSVVSLLSDSLHPRSYKPKPSPSPYSKKTCRRCPHRHQVAVKLAACTDIRFSLAIGGLNLKLKKPNSALAPMSSSPPLVNLSTTCATPPETQSTPSGVLSWTKSTGCPKVGLLMNSTKSSPIPRSKQMTDSVDQLIRLSPKSVISTATTLIQEFVRIRPQR